MNHERGRGIVSQGTPSLRPQDVAVALQLVLTPGSSFAKIAENVGISVGEAHNAFKRLQLAKLISAAEGRVNKRLLRNFLVHGVPHAFPAKLGPETRGIPTAHSAVPLRDLISSNDPIVWPSADGPRRGQSLIPLYPGAPRIARKNRELYHALALVDALRMGRSRERKLASDLLQKSLQPNVA